MRMCMSPLLEREPRAQRPRARDWISTKVEAAVRGRRLHRADTTGVGAEEIDLGIVAAVFGPHVQVAADRKSTRLNSSHLVISYAVFCLKKKKKHFSRLSAVHQSVWSTC